MTKIVILSSMLLCAVVGCGQGDTQSKKAETKRVKMEFVTSDTTIQKSYDWAEEMALSYAHSGEGDAVGAWYEAALPEREAFCMRDVSHQSIGANVLGLQEHNYNMMSKFAENISESKDWCSYWEINRYDKPAPVDYENDNEFWYNLNANFDVIHACLNLYRWSGDRRYIDDPAFINFYEKSLNEYVARWQLEPELLMSRPMYMNSPLPFDQSNAFHTSRGLPSYVESFYGMTAGVDLVASLYAGYKAYSDILAIQGNQQRADSYMQVALKYRDILEKQWWSEKDNYYYTFYTDKGEFHAGEGQMHILWFDATTDSKRIDATIDGILDRSWNVETQSHLAKILYKHGRVKDGYKYISTIPYVDRSEYPEVSYGVVEAIVCGMMGVDYDASKGLLTTLPRLQGEATASLTSLPIEQGSVDVCHISNIESEVTNNVGKEIVCRVSFDGDFSSFTVDGVEQLAVNDNDISYVDIVLESSKSIKVKAGNNN